MSISNMDLNLFFSIVAAVSGVVGAVAGVTVLLQSRRILEVSIRPAAEEAWVETHIGVHVYNPSNGRVRVRSMRMLVNGTPTELPLTSGVDYDLLEPQAEKRFRVFSLVALKEAIRPTFPTFNYVSLTAEVVDSAGKRWKSAAYRLNVR